MKKQIFISSVLTCLSAYAAADIGTAPYIGRITGQGAVSNNIFIFNGDAMLPTLGNQNGFVYADVDGADATNKSWLASPGLGFRDIINNVIYGAYTYGDYQVSNQGGNFWVMNPGLEVMSPHWDGHLNGYIALNRTSQNGSQVFADTVGITQGELPTGNSFDDIQVFPIAVIGSGIDVAAGYSFPYKKNLRARVSLGGYFYQAPSNLIRVTENINGITGGLRLALSPSISVAVNDSYDNVFENIASLSMSYSFGSEDNDNLYSSDVHDRMLAPNVRHVGIVGTGAGQMAQQAYQVANGGAEEQQFGNVFYFNPTLPMSTSQIAGSGVALSGITLGDCTAAHPCGEAALNQTNIDSLYTNVPNANFFLSTGTFNATGGLTFHEGQNIYGYNTGFLTPASGSSRPLIDNEIIFDGGNNILKDMQVSGKNNVDEPGHIPFSYAVFVSSGASGTVQIIDSNLLVNLTTPGTAFSSVAGVINNSSADLSITRSSIDSSFVGSDRIFNVYGVANYLGTTNITDSTIEVLAGGSAAPAGRGIYAPEGSVVVNTSSLSVDSNYQSVGLETAFSSDGSIAFDHSDMVLIKNGTYASAKTEGSNITFDDSLCTIDGVGPVAC